MKIQRTEFAKLTAVIDAIVSRHVPPQQGTAAVCFGEDVLTIRASDYHSACVTNVPCEDPPDFGNGELEIDWRLTARMISSCPLEAIELKFGNDNITISSGKFTGSIPLPDQQGIVPAMPTAADVTEVNCARLMGAMSRALCATDAPTIKTVAAYDSAIFLDGDAVFATNGRTMYVDSLDLMETKVTYPYVAFPRELVSTITAVPGDETITIGISEDTTKLFFVSSAMTLMIATMEIKIPNYQSVLPTVDPAASCIINAGLLREVISRASIVAARVGKSKTQFIEMEITDGFVEIFAISGGMSNPAKTTEIATANTTGAGKAIFATNVLDILRHIKGDAEISIYPSHGRKPAFCKLRDATAEWRYVIVPASPPRPPPQPPPEQPAA